MYCHNYDTTNYRSKSLVMFQMNDKTTYEGGDTMFKPSSVGFILQILIE